MKRIDEVYLFVAEDETGEGIVAVQVRGAWWPMVAADEARVASFRPIAQAMAAEKGKRIRLVRFSVRAVTEEYGP